MKRCISSLLCIIMCLSLCVIPTFAKEPINTGFEKPDIVIKEITQEELNQKNNEDIISINNEKYSDPYWQQFSKPYYTYVNTMTEKQKELYDKVYNSLYIMIDGGNDLTDTSGIQYLTPMIEFDSNDVSPEEALAVGYLMLYDHPEFYFLSTNITINKVENTNKLTLQLGVYKDFALAENRKNCAKTIKEGLNNYLNLITETNPLEIEKHIHDIICMNNTYNAETKYNQSIASVILYGQTVCAGYSEMFMALCNAKGIPTISVTSNAHQWNEIKLDDYWYVVDLTWNDCNDNLSYSVYNVGYPSILDNSHEVENLPWTQLGYPNCYYDYGKAPKLDNTNDYVYRLYNPNSGEHLYTINYYDVCFLVSIGWQNEGIAWQSPKISNIPIYRLYNPNALGIYGAGAHHYTTDIGERNWLISLGWQDEGIAFYSNLDNNSIDVYKLYNPNNGAHLYTMSFEEVWILILTGWQYEGVAWQVQVN